MTKLLLLLLAVTVLAFMSQQKTASCLENHYKYRIRDDYAYLLMLAILVLFAGLRTSYNDTQNYISGFRSMPKLGGFLQNPDSYNPFKNPLFYFLESALKTVTDNPQWLIFLTSLFTQVCFVRFFKRYSRNFAFTMFLYLTYGTFCFSLAAMKQVFGMAVLTLAIPYLERKQWIRYYLLVFIAMLIHTYSIVFAILPFFYVRPWKPFTFLVVALLVVVLMNFEEVITKFMEQANDLGKTLADYEVFDDNTINVLRLLVYMVVPLLSLVFSKWVFYQSRPMDHILVHMSILSCMFMSMGTQAGANMFARMATYFELGTLCCLPWMIDKIFEKRSASAVSCLAVVLFLGYFTYAFGISVDFNAEYRAVSIMNLFR